MVGAGMARNTQGEGVSPMSLWGCPQTRGPLLCKGGGEPGLLPVATLQHPPTPQLPSHPPEPTCSVPARAGAAP